MEQLAYERLVRSFCEAAGIDEWRTLADGRHIAVDGHVVGLLHDDEDGCSNQLAVNIELAPVAAQRNSDLFLRLLQANARPQPGMFGSFGVDPDTGNAVYTVRLDVEPQAEGAALVSLVESQVANASAALEGFWLAQEATP